MLRSFAGNVDVDKLDRAAFQFEHRLLGHPARGLQNLARVILALPKDRVMYPKGSLETGAGFEATFRHRTADRTLEEANETIRVSDSYAWSGHPNATHFSDAVSRQQGGQRVPAVGLTGGEQRRPGSLRCPRPHSTSLG
jgi:hypothetical protein